jgi:hypothetical protein
MGNILTQDEANALNNLMPGNQVLQLGSKLRDIFQVLYPSMSTLDSPIKVTAAPTSATTASRGGAIAISMDRDTDMSTSDGNSDTGLKISCRNLSASAAYARTRCIEATAECRDSGNGSFSLEGAYLAVKNRSGSVMSDTGSMTAIRAETNHNATGTCEVVGINVNDITQSFTASALYGIKFTTGNYGVTRNAAIHVTSANASGWTNIVSLADDNHTNFLYGAVEGGCVGTTKATPATTQAADGSIKVLIGAKTLYIPLFNAVTV